MKNIGLLFLFLSLSFSTYAQENTTTWTLQECVQYALEHNIKINQSYLDVKAAEIDQSDALGNYLPSLNASASNNWNSGLTQSVTTGVLEEQTTRNFSFNASLSVPIFHGLQNLREWQRAKLSQLASEYSLEQMKDNVLLNVANAYLTVLVNKEQVRIFTQQNQVTKQQLRRTRVLIETGVAPAGDSLNIKATDAKEQQQIIEAENNVQIALINLAQILQIDDYKNFHIADASYHVPLQTILTKSPEEIIAQAKETRYEVKIAETDLDLAKKDVAISKSQFYPTLDGFVNFNTRASGADRVITGGIDPNNPTSVIGHVSTTGDPVVTQNFSYQTLSPDAFFDQLSTNKGFTFGFRLSIPIFNGFATRNSVKRQKIAVKRKEYQLTQTKLELESNIYQAYVDAQGAAKAFKAAQVAVTAQSKAYDYAKEQYDVGKITSFEFSQAKFNLSKAKSQLVSAKYDYIFKLKVLELYFGIDPDDLTL